MHYKRELWSEIKRVEKSPLDPEDQIFSHTSDVLLTVDLLPFCQHVANSLLLEGDVIGHLDLK